MRAFNQGLIKTILIVSILPLIPAFLLSLSPAGLLLVSLVAYFAWSPFQRGVNRLFRGFTGLIGSIFSGLFKLIGLVFKGVFRSLGLILRAFGLSFGWLAGLNLPSARFMGWFERWRLLSAGNQGPLVDGRSSRLTEQAGYESLLVQGGMGRGKSSTFVLPNLLSPPSSLPSFVVSDTSGELYQASSGYLASRGYLIRVLNLMDPAHSETYNPLANATAPQHLAELAKTLVRSASGRSAGQAAHDPFWDQSAEKMIRILAQCLLNQPEPSYRNLANLRHLVLGFDAHVAPQGQLGQIDRFVLSATQNDQSTFAAYRAFVQGNLKTIQSVLMTADVSLDAIATPEMAALTATNTLSFGELRQRPTALYVMVNQTQMELFAFLLNLFYADLFKALLKDPTNPGRPVWLFLDEFGHLQIPGFEVFATTARKYKVSYSLFLQSLAQLEGRYGAQNARTIVEGLGTEIYLPGTSLETARNLEARLGRTDKAPLMAANDIIRMEEDQALMLYSNRLPVLLNTKRYYQRADLRRRARRASAPLPPNGGNAPRLIQL
ncbi:type IV secretory system conjugative DNA transfer family protein [Pseudooceanicola atlanticus]|uniref:type IV secretory system conjugative DNA transfer family protein n=1 Tax=Pseudooceanicola atlanticus TaxID=1461694 RepID=UPI002357A903|nr:type IV secretory system conjugative DNA transfer family protein [Pseudooceanicola atlanticus]